MKTIFKKRTLLALCLGSLAASAQASDLLISEYIEGSSYNKAIELFNQTDLSIDLSGYTLEYYFNGNTTAGRTIDLVGSVDSGDVFVLAQAQASVDILAQADQTDSSTSWFNGDDAVVLKNNGVIIDSIGQVGFDPGAEWGSGDTSTKDNTLNRAQLLADIDPSDAFDPAVLWQGEAKDTFAGLGSFGDVGVTPEQPEPTQFVKIHQIQGAGEISPLKGQTVTVEAIVTAEMLEGMNSFFIQEELADYDDSQQTSEGVLVYAPNTASIAVGDKVQVTGTVTEYFGVTEIKDVTQITVLESGVNLAPTDVSLPFASADFMERHEGMLVRFPQVLSVTENYDLGRYGEFWLSSGGRLMNPTNVVAPGEDAIAMQAANDLNRILVDDRTSAQNPDPVIYPAPALDAINTLRSGSQTQDLTGVVSYGFNQYRVVPTEVPEFSNTNPRTTAPIEVGGSLKVASFNVLNYFNGDGQGGGFPTSRGADTLEEFERQQAKIVSAITAMNADIIGLMEIENDGYASTSAIASLVTALNAEIGEARYAFINPGVAQIGTDEIAVGLIYNQQTVAPKGAAAILDGSVDARFIDDKNRPALAQSFAELATNGVMTVAVNHLKSKGSSCDTLGDPDIGDGQGNCNLTRTAAAEALVDWLATDPTASGDNDRLIIGDLNAYAMEDPIRVIKDAGYADLIQDLNGGGYSYIFSGQAGYLDHALASMDLQSQVVGVTEWHINTDEPRALDYNTEFKSLNQQITYYSADAYRSSDHDPVVIGFNLNSDANGEMTKIFLNSLTSAKEVQTTSRTRGNRNYITTSRVITVSIQVIDDLNTLVEGARMSGRWDLGSNYREASCITDVAGQCDVSLITRSATSPERFIVDSIIYEKVSKEEAEQIKAELEGAGAEVEVK